MAHTFMKIVKTGRQDLRALYMTLSPEGAGVSFQYLLLEELKNYSLFWVRSKVSPLYHF